MLKLYHCENARSFRPLWALEELGLEYELKMLPFPPRVLEKNYLDINPLGTIPAFFDGDMRMTESAAICHYLVVRYGPSDLNIEPSDPRFGSFLNWLHFGEATLTFPQTLILRYSRLEPEERRQPQVVEDYTRWFLGRLRAVEALLAEQPYMCGEHFTAADISVAYAMMMAEQLGLSAQFGERVAGYWQHVQQRPAFQRSLVQQRTAAVEQGIDVY